MIFSLTRSKKTALFAAAALILALSFAFALFHHHEDESVAGDCSVCLLVSKVSFFTPAAAALLLAALFSGYIAAFFISALSTAVFRTLKDRAPPALS